jgi:hypothetical protein
MGQIEKGDREEDGKQDRQRRETETERKTRKRETEDASRNTFNEL